MRILGIIAALLGAIGLVVSILTVVGNPDLQVPGPSLIQWPAGWRIALGIVLWGGAVWISVALMALTRVPGPAWLMLLVYLLLFPVYFILGGMMPNLGGVIAAIVILGVVVPVVVWLAAFAIGGAIRRRRAAQGVVAGG